MKKIFLQTALFSILVLICTQNFYSQQLVQSFVGENVSATNYGYSVSEAGDVNNDGFTDIIIGAYGYNSNTGRVYIYYGGSIMNNTADVIMDGENMGDEFGISVSGLGDMNNDGYDDVIVGAYKFNSLVGRVYVFYGGSSMDNTADVIMDGENMGDEFGISVSGVGDMNNDGYDDAIVGSPYFSSATGRAYIYFGSSVVDNAADIILNGETPSYFGYSVSEAGDVNNDGYGDVIVGALGYNSQTGRAYIYYGGTSLDNTADVTMTGQGESDRFGESVSNAGDVNNDGYDDVIIGAVNYYATTGRAYIYHGGNTMDNTSDVIMNGEGTSNWFGISVSRAGDVNNDGFDDVIVGAYAFNSYTGRAYIYFGSTTMDNSADLTMTGEGTNNKFGFSVSGAGDVNNDLYDDVIVGAYLNPDNGKAYIYSFEQFTEQTSLSLPGVSSSSVTWGDYDSDGDLDFLLTGISAGGPISKIYQNTGSGFDEVFPGSLISVYNSSVAWGDYDNDGDLDILLTGDDGSNSISKIYQNTGSGFLEVFSGNLGGVWQSSVAWGDYDNDGNLDILLTGSGVTKIYHNTGSGFTEVFTGSIVGTFSGSVSWGDYDNDGDLDILLAGGNPNNTVTEVSKIYQNTGNGFTEVFSGSLIPTKWSSAIWGDYDSDGDLDILLTGYNSDIGLGLSKIYQNSGSGFIEVFSGDLTAVALGSSAWGDYDNDGDLDILLTGWGNSKIYQNTGSGFNEILAGSLTGVSEGCVAWGDYDNDGDLDILMTGYNGSGNKISKIYRNNNLTANNIPSAPTNLSSSITGQDVSLSWDKSTDNETPQNGLKYNLVIGSSAWAVNTLSPMSDRTTGYRRVINLGNTNHNNSWKIKGLAPGTYYWSVQAIDNCFAGSLFASEQTFTVLEPVIISLISPNGGEIWKVGSSYDIKWNTSGVDNVDLAYSTNNGSSWEPPIISNHPASSGKYTWTIPNAISTQCKVKISKTGNGVSDESNAIFEIKAAGVTAEVEPNNAADVAMNVGIIEEIEGTISPENDVDYFKFTASAGDVVQIYGEERNSSNLYGLIMLFDQNGSQLSTNSNFMSTPTKQRIVYQLPSSGVYYVRYSNQNNWGIYPNNAVKGNEVENKTERIGKLEKATQQVNAPLALNGDYRLTIGYFTPSAPIPNNAYWNALAYNSVVFGGDLYPNDLPTTVTFEYGLTTGYGSTIQPDPAVYEGLNEVGVNQVKATGLQANTEYHFRMKAENAAGTDYSYDRTFTTPEEPEGWVFQESGLGDQNIPLSSVCFTSENIGFIVADIYILKTTNGGTNWVNQTITNGYGLREIAFATSNIGVAVGANGTIARTTDGGTSWVDQVGVVINNYLYAISFGDANTGYACGYNGTILKSTDAGASWNVLGNSPTTSRLYGVHFFDANHGALVGQDGIIITTTDGGSNWFSQTIPNNWWLFDVNFADINNGWAVGDGDKIYHSSDGGLTWNLQNLNNWYSLNSIYFIDVNNGTAVGDGGVILRTSDGGNNWLQINSGTTASLYDVFYNVKGTIVGEYATILRSVDYLTLNSPNGREIWKVGSSYDIKWNGSGVDNVDLSYSTDNGTNWTNIVTNQPASSGKYTWTVPNAVSTQCKVKISKTGNGVSDESNGVFEIRVAGVTAEVEPNNTANEAMNVGVIDEIYGTISPENDVDYFKFTASAGDIVNIYGEERNGSGLYGLIMLFGQNGNQLQYSYYFNNTSTRQRIIYQLPNSGIYYVRYSNQNNWGSYPNSAVKGNGENDETNGMARAEGEAGEINAPLALSGDYRLTIGYFTPIAPVANNAYWNAATYNSVRFYGNLYPNGLPTTVTFEYGLTNSYGSTIQPNPAVYEGLNEVGTNEIKITGLQANAEYHYRMKAENSLGIDYSDDRTFTTPAEPEGWVHQESGLSNENTSLRGAYFTDENNGFAVGSNYILKTTNGGTNWTNQEISNVWGLQDISFATSSIGIAVGGNGTIARTTDGGTTWSSQSGVVTNYYLLGISFGDANIGYAVGDNGTIIKTTDAGSSWNVLSNSPTTEGLRGVHFKDANKGTIVGYSGVIITTTDAGTNWNLQTLPSGRNLYGVHYSDENNGWAVGNGDEAYHTTDGGISWNPQNIGTWTSLYSVYFTDANNGTAVGSGGRIFRTANGGNGWTQVNGGTTSSLYDVYYNVKGTIVGYYATILRSIDYLSVNSPNGGEIWKVGSSYDIKWNYSGVDNIDIAYSTNNGSSWEPQIISSHPASSGKYTWTIPNAISTQCKVKITKSGNGVSDESNGVFEIRVAGVTAEVEPNNTANEAMNVGVIDEIYGTISPENDIDYFKFTASAGDIVNIYGEERNTSDLYGLIMLFDQNGNQLYNNSYFNNTQTKQRIVYELPNNGIYYVRYSNNNNWGNYPNSAVKGNEKEYETERMGKLEKSTQQANAPLALSGDYRLTIGYFTPTAPIANNAWANGTYNSMIFYGGLYPNGLPTTVTFEYGLTNSYGSTIQPNPAVYEGLNEVGTNEIKITGLQANAEYHYRMKAENSLGIDYSDDRTFTTPAEPNGWVHQSSGLSNYNISLQGVHFTDENTGYAVGERYILKTTNGGTNWTNQEISNGWGLQDISFATSSIGVAVGGYGTIARTTDGGTTWSSQYGVLTNYYLLGISFGDANVGFAVGDNGTIIKTTDAGSSWNVLSNSPTTEGLRGVHFTDAIHGTIVGWNGKIITTTNGGTNWNLQTLPSGRSLYAVHYSDANNGWAVGEGDEAYHTTDGGVTWNAQNLGIWTYLYGVYFTNVNSGTAVGGWGRILRTADGGKNWTSVNSGTTLFLLDIYNVNPYFVVGEQATILKSTGVLSTLNLTVMIEGFYNGTNMISDVVTVQLHNASSPFSLVEQTSVTLNTSGVGTANYFSSTDGTSYYISVIHRNAIETWSATPQAFSGGTMSYNFTTGQTQAYGDNLKLKGSKWCIYSGDVNQDGIIDLSDVSQTDIDNLNFVSGYVVTDVNGDTIVDLSDISIVDINNLNFVSKIIPLTATLKKEKKQLQTSGNELR